MEAHPQPFMFSLDASSRTRGLICVSGKSSLFNLALFRYVITSRKSVSPIGWRPWFRRSRM